MQQAFADARPVGVCSVDKVNAEVNGLLDDVFGILFILGRPDDPIATEAHRTEPQSVHR